MQFKKDDLVRCVALNNPQGDGVKYLILNEIYIVYENGTKVNVDISTKFGNFNHEIELNCQHIHGVYPRRFKKVSAEDLSEKEKFKYIKYKLGIR